MSAAFLSLYADRELAIELERRKKIKEEGEKPGPLFSPDFGPLRADVIAHIGDIAMKGAGADDNRERYIYEAAVAAVYGSDVWKWINKKLGGE